MKESAFHRSGLKTIEIPGSVEVMSANHLTNSSDFSSSDFYFFWCCQTKLDRRRERAFGQLFFCTDIATFEGHGVKVRVHFDSMSDLLKSNEKSTIPLIFIFSHKSPFDRPFEPLHRSFFDINT
jgi:hypothetical protein